MADRGTKRKCQSCGAAYYDLERSPVVCPKCGVTYEPPAPVRAPARRLPATPRKEIPIEKAEPVDEIEVEIEGEADVDAAEEDFEEADELLDEPIETPDEDEGER